jgi:2-oxopent-4-enoate hydratase
MNSDLSSTDLIVKCADTLYDAEVRRVPVAPLTEQYPQLTTVDAYRVQLINVARRTRAGQHIIGRKVGLTAKAMQDLFGVREPDYGHLLDTMLQPVDAPLDLSELIDPQIEVEPAFVLGKRLVGPALTVADVLAATDHICVCFEVIDSRIRDWRIKIQDTVADNGSSARLILGARKVKPDGLARDQRDTVLEVDGRIVERGSTGAILGHPANGVAWLANTLASFGVALEPGDLVLPGTCTRSYRIAGHQRVKGRISQLGEVAITLNNAPTVVHPAAP